MSKFIVLNQVLYQDYHLLISALNQNGHLYTFVCLGGQGSQKKQTGKKCELAYVIEVEAFHENPKLKKHYLKEFEIIYYPKNLRNNYNAWCVLNFILEVTHKMITEKELHAQEWKLLKVDSSRSHEYELLVKFLFYLEEVSIQCIDKFFAAHLCLFYITKVLIIQGLLPNLEICHACNRRLESNNVAHFEDSHFYCMQCAPSREQIGKYWSFLHFSKVTKYEQIKNMDFNLWKKIPSTHLEVIFDLNFALMALSKNSLRSYALISK